MSLEIETKEREGISILDLHGRITMGEEAGKFRQAVQSLARGASPKLILNMQHVDYIDSTGLGAIVMSATSFRKNGGEVKLLNFNRRNIELLVATKLPTISEVFAAEQDALTSFLPAREIKQFYLLQVSKL